jgi:hypothetical protein
MHVRVVDRCYSFNLAENDPSSITLKQSLISIASKLRKKGSGYAHVHHTHSLHLIFQTLDSG